MNETIKCKTCNEQFENSEEECLILCNFKQGMVHLNCCINNCSWDKKPCVHSAGVYEKFG